MAAKNQGLQFSKGFNLAPEILGAVASGSYDNVELKNGAQTLKFTRFGYGLGTQAALASGGEVEANQFDNIDVRKNRVSLNRIPVEALAGGKDLDIKLGQDKRIRITSPDSLLARTSATTKTVLLTGVIGLAIVGVALYATR